MTGIILVTVLKIDDEAIALSKYFNARRRNGWKDNFVSRKKLQNITTINETNTCTRMYVCMYVSLKVK